MINQIDFKALIFGLIATFVFAICFGFLIGGVFLVMSAAMGTDIVTLFDNTFFLILAEGLAFLNFFLSAAVGAYICLSYADKKHKEHAIILGVTYIIIALLSGIFGDSGLQMDFIFDVVIIAVATFAAYSYFKYKTQLVKEGVSQ